MCRALGGIFSSDKFAEQPYWHEVVIITTLQTNIILCGRYSLAARQAWHIKISRFNRTVQERHLNHNYGCHCIGGAVMETEELYDWIVMEETLGSL
jgi:hypothetical protein